MAGVVALFTERLDQLVVVGQQVLLGTLALLEGGVLLTDLAAGAFNVRHHQLGVSMLLQAAGDAGAGEHVLDQAAGHFQGDERRCLAGKAAGRLFIQSCQGAHHAAQTGGGRGHQGHLRGGGHTGIARELIDDAGIAALPQQQPFHLLGQPGEGDGCKLGIQALILPGGITAIESDRAPVEQVLNPELVARQASDPGRLALAIRGAGQVADDHRAGDGHHRLQKAVIPVLKPVGGRMAFQGTPDQIAAQQAVGLGGRDTGW